MLAAKLLRRGGKIDVNAGGGQQLGRLVPELVAADVRIFDRLFTIENTGAIPEGETFDDYLNRDSVTVLPCCVMEKALESAAPGERFQFVRTGYFCRDTKDTGVFNRIVELKDSKPF